ncbi:MAG: hypothetical protein HQ567_28035 [Candidatus Nealsonbacteria bacterium]|nr:hypothetical protein [Candidatus Nealsonbacteria bacterium]
MEHTPTGHLFRIAALASCVGIAYAIYGAATAEGMTPLLYIFFWLPVFCGLAAVLFLASRWVPHKVPSDQFAKGMRRLRVAVDVILGIGCIALIIEAIVIASERKQLQALELMVLVSLIAAFRVGVRCLDVNVQHRINIACIVTGSLIAVLWFPILDFILGMFDVD